MTNVAESQLSLPLDQLTLSDEVVHLPPEVWELIFGQLRGKHLLTVRLVCHHWKTIVDGKRSLWNGMRIVKMKSGSAPPIPEIYLRGYQSIVVSTWWPAHGEHLASISLTSCNMALETLVEMLRLCPNLTSLCLTWIHYTCTEEPEAVDFRLEKLEELTVDYVFDVFIKICPNLRKLAFTLLESEDQVYKDGIHLIQSVQKTLENLQVYLSARMIQEIARMNGLRLKNVHFEFLNVENSIELLMEFCRCQPLLEKMVLTKNPHQAIDNSTLIKYGQNLPRLKGLDMTIDSEASLVPSFLSTMGHLENLKIFAGDGDNYLTLNLNGYKCPNLTVLTMGLFKIQIRSLHTFLSESKNLRSLTLINCIFDGFAKLFDIIAELPALRRLTLNFNRFNSKRRNIIPNCVSKLNHLQIEGCKGIQVDDLIQICRLSPGLEKLSVWCLPIVGATMMKLCCHLPRVKWLTFAYCSITAASAKHILDHCRSLEYLKVYCEDGSFRKVFENLLKQRCRYVEFVIE